jgi:hypothetical protein
MLSAERVESARIRIALTLFILACPYEWRLMRVAT